MKRLVASVALLLATQVAVAAGDPAFYYTFGYGRAELRNSGTTLSTHAVQLALGWQPSRYLGLEVARFAGISDADFVGLSVKIRGVTTLSVMPTWPLGRDFSLYGRAGWSSATIQASSYDGEVRETDHDKAFGGGIQWTPRVGRTRVGARLEYAQLYHHEGTEIDAITLSFMQRF